MAERRDFIRIFEAHGVEFTGEAGNQLYGYCPFSDRDNKFYVNKDNGLWDSKTGSVSGNVSRFLELRSKSYTSQIGSTELKRLSENRQLPMSAFKGWEVGWDGNGSYTFPVRDLNGEVQDIRRFSIKDKIVRSTPGCKVGLIGSNHLKTRSNESVYLCEGEWDSIALNWLLRSLKEPGVVVGVPGAQTFKPEWARWLQNRTVYTLYDNDPQGKDGEKKAKEKLYGIAHKIYYIHWPDEVPSGFDTRDWIVYGTTLRNTPETCWEKLKRRFRDYPKTETESKVETTFTDGKITIKRKKMKPSRWKHPPTIDELHHTFGKWLFLRNTDSIDVMLAVTLSQRIDGSPVWMFVVGPPGSAKTAIISSLATNDDVYYTSQVSPASLISGANFTHGGVDPSLIPRLQDKIFVVKDFTAILSQPDREQREIFGILRDAYDGHCGKIFGNGVERKYDARFTIIAATTPKVYELGDTHQALGERFLKFLVGDNLDHPEENEIIQRAIENSDRETAMKSELCDVVKAFIERTCAGRTIPVLPDTILTKIISLAKFGARLRGTVSRDRFKDNIVLSRPMAEVGTRLGQQLAKLSRGLAMVANKDTVTEIEYGLIKKVMLDTISQKNEDVIRSMVKAMGGTSVLQPMSLRELAQKTHYPFETLRRIMDDLRALRIIKRQGSGVGSTWTLSDYVKDEILLSELYTDEELARPTIGKIRLTKKLKKFRIKKSVIPMPTKITATMDGTKIIIADSAAVAAPPPGSAPVNRKVGQ